MRATIVLTCVLTWASAAIAGPPPKRASGSPTATPLRTASKVRFSDRDTLAWLQPAQCDANGNLVLVTVPDTDPRDLKALPAMPRYTKSPSDITIISADGKKTTVLSPGTVPEFADAESMITFGATVDSSGTVFALVWVARPEQQGGQYIVSFDRSGRYRSRIAIDLDQMTVQRFAVFGSGEFLLEGVRPPEGRRMAVMPAIGGALQDVFAVSDTASAEPGPPPTISDRLTRAGDGRIYFVPDDSSTVHALTPAGTSEEVFRLSNVPRRWRVFDLKASGNRLAVTYHEAGERADSARYWVAIHDTRFGERLEMYGPSSRPPLCYEYAGQQDRLTVMQGGYLVTLTAF